MMHAEEEAESKLDVVTERNLHTIQSLSGQSGGRGSYEEIDALVMSAIGVLKMLPSNMADHFDRHAFYIGDAHYKAQPARRLELWQRLAAKLRTGLEEVRAEQALNPDKLQGDRPLSQGERLKEACAVVTAALGRRGDLEVGVKLVEAAASGSSAAMGDARKMQRLLNMARIPDEARWRQDFYDASATPSGSLVNCITDQRESR